MKRKFCLLLCMCMLITCLAGISFTASAEMQGDGTENEPYIITTQKEFEEMTGTNHYKLADNVEFIAPVAIKEFKGVFDGNGKTIKLTNASNGLIASLSGTVKNLTVDGAVTLSAGKTGVIANLNFGTITNCKTTDTFVLNANGGQNGVFAGQNYSGTISYCINYGAVNASATNIGGITGHNYQGTVTHCGNHGNLVSTASSSNIAGIVGRYEPSAADADGNVKGLIEACYNIGTITGVSVVGGIVGVTVSNTATIKDCFNNGSITASSTVAGGIIGNTSSAAVILNCYNTGVVKTNTTTNKSVSNAISDGTNVTLTDCYYNTTATGTPKAGSSALTVEQMSDKNNYATNFANWDFNTVWQFNESVNNSYKYPQLQGLTFEVPYPEGTENNPIKIASQEDFEAIKADEGLYYIIQNDFTMDAPKAVESFAGVLLGNDKTITIINGTSYLFKGLTGTIKDLTTRGNVNLSVSTSSVYVGTNNGTITNCKNYAEVTSSVSYIGVFAGKNHTGGEVSYCINYAACDFDGQNSGGIVGYNNYGRIEYCGNQGKLTASDINLGGIVGRYDSGSVSKCYNIGEISGTNNVGGIAGFTLNAVSVSDCFNKGQITGSTNALSPGGIIGGANPANPAMSVVNCYNAGVVKYGTTDKSVTNAISADSDVACTKCYFLNEEDATGKDGSYPLTSEEMKNTEKYSTNFEGFDFANVWTFITVENNSYKYPQLQGITFEIPYELGQEGNPILINNQSDFATLNGSDKYFRINTDNIDLTGAYAIESFSGVLDGNGKTIIITNGTTPLFKVIESGAKVSNLSIEGNINFSGQRFGALAGTNKGTVYGVNNSASITSAQYYSGGIVGENIGGTIENCVNYAVLKFSASNAGGIVGYNNGTVKLCGNEGNIVNTAGSGATGGIAGLSYASVYDCYNIGTISAGDGVGGIIGRLSYNSNKTISNCYNAGNIISSASKQAGGIIGDVQITVPANTQAATITVTACFNQGAIMQIMSEKSADWAIMGDAAGIPVTVSECFYLSNEATEAGEIQGIEKEAFDAKVAAFGVTIPGFNDIDNPALYEAYTDDINVLSVVNNFPNKDYIKTWNKPVVLSFANISYGKAGYALKGFGFVISKTDAEPEIGKADCYQKAMEYINPKGNCSIMAYGSYITEGESYYVRPYAVYSYLGVETTIYGDAKSFTAVVAQP